MVIATGVMWVDDLEGTAGHHMICCLPPHACGGQHSPHYHHPLPGCALLGKKCSASLMGFGSDPRPRDITINWFRTDTHKLIQKATQLHTVETHIEKYLFNRFQLITDHAFIKEQRHYITTTTLNAAYLECEWVSFSSQTGGLALEMLIFMLLLRFIVCLLILKLAEQSGMDVMLSKLQAIWNLGPWPLHSGWSHTGDGGTIFSWASSNN